MSDSAAKTVVMDPICRHNKATDATASVQYLEDIGRYTCDLRLICSECGKPFVFLGLPIGLDMNSASVSVDGTEVRLAIAPKGEAVPPIKGVEGFTVTKG